MKKTLSILAGAALISIGTSAIAGPKANPQTKRDLVQLNREAQTELNGPSGFGQHVSMRNRTKTDSDIFQNFGDYLKKMTK